MSLRKAHKRFEENVEDQGLHGELDDKMSKLPIDIGVYIYTKSLFSTITF